MVFSFCTLRTEIFFIEDTPLLKSMHNGYMLPVMTQATPRDKTTLRC